MSNIAMQGGATGTGTVSLVAPSTSTNRTINLPDSNGTMATAESTLTQFNASGSAPVYACRAWVNFNGTGTVAIRASGNVSSITDNGVGSYTVNFTTAMPDANYCVVATAPNNVDATSANRSLGIFASNADPGENSMLVGSVKILLQGGNGSELDQSVACVAIFR